MCLPEPGPRCSHHAYKSYVKAISAHTKASTPEEKERTKVALERKTRIYDSTPKGQNELKRSLMYSESPEVKADAQRRLTAGEKLREKQMHDYLIVKIRKNRMFDGEDSQEKLSRKMETVAVAMYSFADGFSDGTSEVVNETTLKTKLGKFFVIGSKATIPLFVFDNTYDDSISNVVSTVPETHWAKLETPDTSLLMNQWFSALKNEGYVGIAVVNINTSEVAFLDFADTLKVFDIQFKLKKKLGGTTKWVRGKDSVVAAFGHLDEFKNAIYTTGPNGLTVSGIGYIMKNERTQGEIFLSEVKDEENNFAYIVRRRHNSNKSTVNALLRPKTLAFSASISDSLREAAEAINDA